MPHPTYPLPPLKPFAKLETARVWRKALTAALVARGDGDMDAALLRLAEKFLRAVDMGDVAAFKELADRLDGKAVQSTEISGPNGEAPTGWTILGVAAPCKALAGAQSADELLGDAPASNGA